jgi:cysteinyl-tRNA synthetase
MKTLAYFSLLALFWPGRAALAQSPPTSFAYVLQADALARSQANAVELLGACGRDWMVLDAAFAAGSLWTRADLDTMRARRPGRKIIAYISIGEAEDYRPYWRSAWISKGQPTAAAPSWLLGENPEWKGNYRVKYWQAGWQALILASVEEAMQRGFDGVYLDIVDGFETFEQQGGDYVDDCVNPETKQSYRRDMADWVKAIAARARTIHPGALAIPQNGSQLLAQPDFLETISAIGIEDLFTDGDKVQPRPHSQEVLGDLQKITAAGKPVLVIDYPTKSALAQSTKEQARSHHFVWLVTDRQLKTLGESGN